MYRIGTESLDPEITELFYVHPITGELVVLRALDFEALNKSDATFTLTVEAVDMEGAMPPGVASVTVRIMVGLSRGPNGRRAKFVPLQSTLDEKESTCAS